MSAHRVRSAVVATVVSLAVMLPVGFATTDPDGPWPSTVSAWAGAPSEQIRAQLDRAIKVLSDLIRSKRPSPFLPTRRSGCSSRSAW